MPLVASLHVTPTLWCVQVPLVYGVPSALIRLMPVGAVLSTLTDSDVVALLPTLSVQVPVTACAAPSAEIVTAGLPGGKPGTGCLQLDVTGAQGLFPPVAFGGPAGGAGVAGLV